MDSLAAALAGDRYALARLLSAVENGGQEAAAIVEALCPRAGRAHLVGVTGAPGTGKSTLIGQLARHLRASGQSVAIVAVDPSSPFTGGALLGDRVRMRDLTGDPEVFVRSMATRGASGGVARTTADAALVLDAVGFDVVLIETVGAGQSEVEVARMTHATIVVEAPGSGDDVQALKAGLLEIADILVVNKMDLPGGAHKVRALELATTRPADDERPEVSGWHVPIIPTVALTGEGLPELRDALVRHRISMQQSGSWDRGRRERIRSDLVETLQRVLMSRLQKMMQEDELESWVTRIAAREASVLAAAEQIVDRWEASGYDRSPSDATTGLQ
ncbi:MAG: methylmalonyl Co-A mutase-associated GTPase MeaB [Chloroflexi bacterium]|nr:methylmalonyl Co-A mutase-associated GTPase MeaB [Chloroflexota bacterium]